MYLEAELVLKSYKPLKLEEGMLFVNKIARTDVVEVFILEELPDDEEKFIVTHGYPMEPYIILDADTETPIILAIPEQIGWWDDGDDVDEVREISIEEINNVISQFDGLLEIYLEDDEVGDPLLIENKVILKYLTEELNDDECEDWEDNED
jgi:hypothetical protein